MILIRLPRGSSTKPFGSLVEPNGQNMQPNGSIPILRGFIMKPRGYSHMTQRPHYGIHVSILGRHVVLT